ncbi:hypothetical protein AGMMS49975_27170 [Clostridia bacterium]|nr:hypothetical protein AGMMS49975_27170 [Clostridia bacterium]
MSKVSAKECPRASQGRYPRTPNPRKIGTYSISIRPFEDCCTLFVAKHPETKPKKSIIESIERGITDLRDYLDDAVNNVKIYEF